MINFRKLFLLILLAAMLVAAFATTLAETTGGTEGVEAYSTVEETSNESEEYLPQEPAEEPAAPPAEEQPSPTEAPPSPTDAPPSPTEAPPSATAAPTAPAEATNQPEEMAATEVPDTDAPKVDRSVSIKVHGQPGSFKAGDTVVLEAVLKGYEGVEYELAWEYSVDGAAWSTAPGVADQLTYTFTIDEETATWHWRVVVEPFETIEDLDVPLSAGLIEGDNTGFIVGCVVLGLLLLGGAATAFFLNRSKGEKE